MSTPEESALKREAVLRAAGHLLSEEVNRLERRIEEGLVAEWLPLAGHASIHILHVEGPCLVRFPETLRLREVDAALVGAGLLRVGPPRPLENGEGTPPRECVATLIPLETVDMHPREAGAHPAGVDTEDPRALAVALFDALRGVLDYKLHLRHCELSRTLLLLHTVESAVERLRPAE